MVVFVQTFPLARLDVRRHRLHGCIAVLSRHGVQNLLVILMNALELLRIVPAPANGKYANEQPRVVQDLLNSRVPGHAHQQCMEPEIAFDKPSILLLIKLGQLSLVQFLLEHQELIQHVLQPVPVGRPQRKTGHAAHRVHFQRFAKLIKLDNILAFELGNHHAAVPVLLQQAFGIKLFHRLADRGTTATQFFSEYQLAHSRTGPQNALGHQFLDVPVRALPYR